MKLITAVIKPFRMEEVKEAIVAAGAEGATLREVRGFGRQKGQIEISQGSESCIDWLPKFEVTVAVPDELKDAVVSAIIKAANHDKIGDGKIFVTTLDEAIRIRTRETGDVALRDPTVTE